MKQYNSLFFLYGLLLFTGCEKQKIDESFAAQQVQNALSLSGIISAKQLSGGYSGMPIFKVKATGGLTYVIRFLERKSLQDREQEILGLKHASNFDYGPHLYFIADENAFIIMEYIDNQKITLELRQSDKLYTMLAQLLRKMHNAPAFTWSAENYFEIIYERCKILSDKKSAQTLIPLEKIKNDVQIIEKTLKPYATVAPCHNDLNPNNLLFAGNKFIAIDFESVGQADHYVDLATIVVFYCFTPQAEAHFFKTYLGHKPSNQENAKLFLMKEIVRLKYALVLLKLSPEALAKYDALPNISFIDFCEQQSKGTIINIDEPIHKIHLAKILINQALSDIASDTFKQAADALQK